jgi:hypothetical protein
MRIGLPLINYSDQHDARGFGPVSVRLFGKRRRVDPDEKELVDAKKKFIEAFLEAVKASKWSRMPNLELLDIYFFASISQVVLMFIAVYYAIHIMHKVGTFWAWTLMVVAFGVLALHDFTSVASVISTPEVQLIAKTEAFTITSYLPGAILNEIAYATLAVATYGLATIFREKAVKVTAAPLSSSPRG